MSRKSVTISFTNEPNFPYPPPPRRHILHSPCFHDHANVASPFSIQSTSDVQSPLNEQSIVPTMQHLMTTRSQTSSLHPRKLPDFSALLSVKHPPVPYKIAASDLRWCTAMKEEFQAF